MDQLTQFLKSNSLAAAYLPHKYLSQEKVAKRDI